MRSPSGGRQRGPLMNSGRDTSRGEIGKYGRFSSVREFGGGGSFLVKSGLLGASPGVSNPAFSDFETSALKASKCVHRGPESAPSHISSCFSLIVASAAAIKPV